jgi:hypothetical protein
VATPETEERLLAAVHEEGCRLERQPEGELRFRRPYGRERLNVAYAIDVLHPLANRHVPDRSATSTTSVPRPKFV